MYHWNCIFTPQVLFMKFWNQKTASLYLVFSLFFFTYMPISLLHDWDSVWPLGLHSGLLECFFYSKSFRFFFFLSAFLFAFSLIFGKEKKDLTAQLLKHFTVFPESLCFFPAILFSLQKLSATYSFWNIFSPLLLPSFIKQAFFADSVLMAVLGIGYSKINST